MTCSAFRIPQPQRLSVAVLVALCALAPAAFADTARAMHSGEQPTSAIHGQATREEAKALVDEGVAVAPLPLPVKPPETLN